MSPAPTPVGYPHPQVELPSPSGQEGWSFFVLLSATSSCSDKKLEWGTLPQSIPASPVVLNSPASVELIWQMLDTNYFFFTENSKGNPCCAETFINKRITYTRI
jgi:hypothetical protein